MTKVASLVFYSAHHEATAEFYRAVGIPIADEQHDDGPVHHACELGGVHVAVCRPRRPAPLQGGERSATPFPACVCSCVSSRWMT